ncbi:MAG: UDP-N-acetylglucosamine 2-epimerase (non-hydrolyzing) [Anaerolineae bacterium]|nr:UDP-N-acetylglucosamine 2-epimerase (non-hydrolyzing) [Anaerolineae bacterium]
MMLLQLVFGTRPEIIKLAPIIKACQAAHVPFILTSTGQHYDPRMMDVFLQELALPLPGENLHVGSASHGQQVGKMLMALESSFVDHQPSVVMAQGDTNSVLAAALAASKLHIPFAHVEAGIRSGDRAMPEEINRIIADQCAAFCFAPTTYAAANLNKENIPPERVIVTGNTIVDACRQHLPLAVQRGHMLYTFRLPSRRYILVTCHRAENVDDPARLEHILRALHHLAQKTPVVLPLHPRTHAAVQRCGFYDLLARLTITEPLGYFDFLQLLASARVVITDSGGVQEESSILETPCLTIRNSTERPETVAAGVNRLIGVDESAIVHHAQQLIADEAAWNAMRGHPALYGAGDAGQRIIDYLRTSA